MTELIRLLLGRKYNRGMDCLIAGATFTLSYRLISTKLYKEGQFIEIDGSLLKCCYLLWKHVHILLNILCNKTRHWYDTLHWFCLENRAIAVSVFVVAIYMERSKCSLARHVLHFTFLIKPNCHSRCQILTLTTHQQTIFRHTDGYSNKELVRGPHRTHGRTAVWWFPLYN